MAEDGNEQPTGFLPQIGSRQATPREKSRPKDEPALKAKGSVKFATNMRHNAMERDAADLDQDGKLDFGEFCTMVRERNASELTEEELKDLFDKLDADGSGQVDMIEYLQWSLRDALTRSSSRVIDLMRAWDEDRSGTVEKKEFFRAVRSLGFEVSQREADAVFLSLIHISEPTRPY